MNVAFFTNNYKPFIGGVPIAIDNLANALRKRNHHVHIFAPDYGEPVEGETDVIRTWSIRNFNDSQFALPIPLALDTYLAFNDVKADMVHVHHPFLLGMSGLNAARAEKVPCVFTYHTQYEKYIHYLPWGGDMIQEMTANIATRFANSCDAVIAPSTDIRTMLQERGVDIPIRVIPTGVDLARFRGGNRTAFKAKLGLKDSDLVMLFVSRLAKEKNIGFLLKAFEFLAEQFPNLHFAIVGSGDEESALKQEAAASHAAGRILFTGVLTGRDLLNAYKGSDFFAFSSHSETQGMVVLEAMAGGCPVVALDAPGVRDVIQNGQNGFLIQNNDLEAFCQAAKELAGNKDLRDRLGQGALQRAKEMSLAQTARHVESLYRYATAHQHPDRVERFIIAREFLKYQFNKISALVTGLIA